MTSYNIQIQASTPFVTLGENYANPDYPDMPPIAAVTWASAGAMTIDCSTQGTLVDPIFRSTDFSSTQLMK
ncbi:hypothetical protein PI124_g18570 [Phytophthora idaei]|nr:hypothetical protein PI125_g19352 [Phytophthora idaei]KAG3136395.1 hypothetical protein PI126_g17844 [Phytophthora idaei]KAG3236428.1 hypothetical protein PI124_g18570 [Phytophthora idaei]